MSNKKNHLDGLLLLPIMSAYSLIIKFNQRRIQWKGSILSGQDMKRLILSVVLVMLVASAASLPFVLNAGFGQLPQGEQLTEVEKITELPRWQIPEYVAYAGVYRKEKYAGRVVGLFSDQTRKRAPATTVADGAHRSCQSAVGRRYPRVDGALGYLQLAGKRILIDPILSDYAAPFSFLNKAFAGNEAWTAQSMPEIDLLIISHDHYDHLDYATIKALMPKIKRVVTPLGVGSHLRYWGDGPGDY